jgi:hypothetical protein
MLNYSVESKSQLAKLLATENIKIEHKSARTASFNLKTRTLVCPVWKDMSGYLYDLLLGHEVSHALETPLEGWHDATCDKGTNFRHFLNVVEDARIEKKIKRRYPGIRKSFIEGYKQLFDDDFFGLDGQDVNKLYFIDRLNIHFKVGTYAKIKFLNDEENQLVKLVEKAETWNDVVYATQKIWDYSAIEQNENQNYLEDYDMSYEYSIADEDAEESEFEGFDDAEDEFENVEPSDSGDAEDEDDSEADSSDADDSESKSNKADNADDAESDSENDDSEDGASNNDVDGNGDSMPEPKCKTDENFRQNEYKLLSDSVEIYTYINIPKLTNEDLIVKPSEVNDVMNKYFADYPTKINLNEIFAKFKAKNDSYINLLAKEFEMRKAAKSYSRSKIADTGDININKLYSYQFDDNIFRKAMIVPKGKSHGLVLLLDMSGSMSDNMTGSIEQILVLSLFCKKVNIPFKVFGFNSYKHVDDVNNYFSGNDNVIEFRNFGLIEFFNSSMNSIDFNKAVKNFAGLTKLYVGWYDNVPSMLKLGTTPLTESVIALQPIVKKFKKNLNLDYVNLVIVHDGDADTVNHYTTESGKTESIQYSKNMKDILRDENEKLDYLIDKSKKLGDGIRESVFKWFSDSTKCKIFGFFITKTTKNALMSNLENRYFDPKNPVKTNEPVYYSQKYAVLKDKYEEIRKQKFLVSKNPGYESFFLILGGKNLEIETEELQVEANANKRAIKSALSKLTKARSNNRVLVSKFIEGIAA